jgi:serine kinase of HPr protein (carbohydrate metabolism regulator)
MSALAAKDGADAGESEAGVVIHASAVAIQEAGVLIRGPSGAGKSALASALIAAARNVGAFARLIGDDRIGLENRAGRLIARGHPAIQGKIERRGQGVVEVPFLSAAVVRLVIDLEASIPPRFPDQGDRATLIGARLPRLRLPQCIATADLAFSALLFFSTHIGNRSGAQQERQDNLTVGG